MAYFSRNGIIYKQEFHRNFLIVNIKIGPDFPMTTKRLAMRIMSKYEHNKQTDNRNYKYAQRVACCLCVGQDTSSDFIRRN